MLLLGALGCGPAGPKTYPVNGKVQVASGEVQPFAGSHVEAALERDPTQRASGEIQADGSFVLETLHAGAILRGAPEGRYQVRILLTEEDGPSNRRAARAIARRYLDFATSGLSLQVPSTGEVTLTISPR